MKVVTAHSVSGWDTENTSLIAQVNFLNSEGEEGEKVFFTSFTFGRCAQLSSRAATVRRLLRGALLSSKLVRYTMVHIIQILFENGKFLFILKKSKTKINDYKILFRYHTSPTINYYYNYKVNFEP